MIRVGVGVDSIMFLSTIGSGPLPPVQPTLGGVSNGATHLQGETLALTASTTDADLDEMQWVANRTGLGTGGTVLATDSASPFAQNYLNALPEGSNTLVARAIRDGLATDSEAITFTSGLPALVTEIYFPTGGTHTKPAKLTDLSFVDGKARGRCWAAGGGGTAATRAGGGGGFSEEPSFTPGTTETVTVPTGGAANTNGSDCSIGTHVVAKGGLSGGNGGTGDNSAGTGTTKRNGGTGATGAGNNAGGGGAGSAANGSGTAGGTPDGGIGQNATAGRKLGAGGGSSAGAGQTGGGGEARIDYYVPATPGFARRMGYGAGRDAGDTTGASSARNAVMPSGIVAGEVLVLVVAVDCRLAAFNVQTPSGWTQLLGGTIRDGTNAIGIAVFWKVAAGGDTANSIVTDVAATPTATQCSYTVTRFANAGTPTATSATGSSTNANPPDTGALSSGNYAIMAACSIDGGSTTLTALPSTYSGGCNIYPATDVGAILSSAHKNITGTSENPGTFTSGNEQWAAVTIAIPYAA